MRALAFPLLVAATAFPASAQVLDTASQRLELAGDAPAACVYSAPRATRTNNATFAVTGQSTAQIGIVQFVDPTTAEPRASEVELTMPVICNIRHQVRVRSINGGLVRAASNNRGSTGFREFLPYAIALDWAGTSASLQSTAQGGTVVGGQPARGDLQLRIATPGGGNPMVAGQYNDSIVIEFSIGN